LIEVLTAGMGDGRLDPNHGGINESEITLLILVKYIWKYFCSNKVVGKGICVHEIFNRDESEMKKIRN
jgi:hypothetical protein